jgi:hypothetical protein
MKKSNVFYWILIATVLQSCGPNIVNVDDAPHRIIVFEPTKTQNFSPFALGIHKNSYRIGGYMNNGFNGDFAVFTPTGKLIGVGSNVNGKIHGVNLIYDTVTHEPYVRLNYENGEPLNNVYLKVIEKGKVRQGEAIK